MSGVLWPPGEATLHRDEPPAATTGTDTLAPRLQVTKDSKTCHLRSLF